jgi:hypothetical protein
MGFVLWTCARKVCYEYVRTHRMQISSRDTLVVSASDFKGSTALVWMKHDEIRYRGQMFDIMNMRREGDKVKLTGHYDKLENKLFKLLHKWLDDDYEHSNQQPQRYLKWIADAVIIPPFYFSSCVTIEKKDFIISPVHSWQSRNPATPYHPPKTGIA